MDRSDGKKRMEDGDGKKRMREGDGGFFPHVRDQNEEAFEWRSVW
jgi:hypothetical protein